VSRLVKLYPPEFRRRYGAELEEAAAAAPGWRTRIDLFRGAVDAWTRYPGGNQVTNQLTRVAAALMVLPLSFLIMNLANEMTGSERILLESFFTSRIGEILVVFSPFAALALVTFPSLSFAIDRQQGHAFSVSLRVGRFQLLVLATAAVTAVAFLGYAFLENFVPRLG
jgi:hypothetical protein